MDYWCLTDRKGAIQVRCIQFCLSIISGTHSLKHQLINYRLLNPPANDWNYVKLNWKGRQVLYQASCRHCTWYIHTPILFPHVCCGLHVVAWQYIYIQKTKSSRICGLSTVQAIFLVGIICYILPPLYPLFVVLGVPSRCQLTVFNTSHILMRIITLHV
jgi:hypothetical protein